LQAQKTLKRRSRSIGQNAEKQEKQDGHSDESTKYNVVFGQ
jgi:hypothetical protein